jgi:hypothetical protein
VQWLDLRVHDACEVVCRAGQAHPDKQHVLVGVLAAFVQPEQDSDRDIRGGPLARSARSLAVISSASS